MTMDILLIRRLDGLGDPAFVGRELRSDENDAIAMDIAGECGRRSNYDI